MLQVRWEYERLWLSVAGENRSNVKVAGLALRGHERLAGMSEKLTLNAPYPGAFGFSERRVIG